MPPLIAELAGAETDAALAAIVGRIADLVHERGELLARERLQAAAVLSEVTKRLEEMAAFLTESNSASRSHFDDTESLNDSDDIARPGAHRRSQRSHGARAAAVRRQRAA